MTSWKTGGAPVWGWISYDPELDLIYYGTGNAAPYNAEQRLGDNKWTTSVLARRPERRRARVGLPVHPARQLGLRRDRGDGPGGPHHRRQARPRRWCTSTRTASPTRSIAPDRAAADQRHRVRARELGEVGGPRDRPPGARSRQADRRLQGQRQGHLPEPRGRGEPVLARRRTPRARTFSIPPPTTCAWTTRPHTSRLQGNALRGGEQPVRGRSRRQPRCVHRLGCGHAARRCGRTRRPFPAGAARW